MARPVRNCASVAVDGDSRLGELLLEGLEFAVVHCAKHLSIDVSELDVVPAKFLRDLDLASQVGARLVCKS